jgi:hypothetical protein
VTDVGATAKNQALDGLDASGTAGTRTFVNQILAVALHVGDPSTTGANENANAGSYARQACTWNGASGGTKTNSTALTFATLGTIAVTWLAGWGSATYAATPFGIGAQLGASVTAASITVASGAISLAAS